MLLGLLGQNHHGLGVARAGTDDENVALVNGGSRVITADVCFHAHLGAIHGQDFDAVACAPPTCNVDPSGIHNGLSHGIQLCLIDIGQHFSIFQADPDSFCNSVYHNEVSFLFSLM